MKKYFVLILAFLLTLPLLLTACNDTNDTTGENSNGSVTQKQTVTVNITNDGGCFKKTTFTVDKGTILDAAKYENITRISNGGKKVYFIGTWKTAEGEDFDFSKPINENVTISPQITQLYFGESDYPYIRMSANEDLKNNPNMKTVVLPIKDPGTGNSMPNSTLVGNGLEDSVFDSFNYIETAVIPEEISNVSGALFLNCTGLKEVYFPGYGYYMNRTITSDFLQGCTALEHIYFADDDAMADFTKMLNDAIENAAEENESTANLERLKTLLAVKTAPYMYWDADTTAE